MVRSADSPDDELAVDLSAELPPDLALALPDLEAPNSSAPLVKQELAMDRLGRVLSWPAAAEPVVDVS